MAAKLMSNILEKHNLDEENIAYTVATGYGRVTFPAHRETSEITCQAKGISSLFNNTRTFIDIGGLDSKVIMAAMQAQEIAKS